jgi:hypothetical protein
MKYIIFAINLLFVNVLYAQTINDALRLSYTNPTGTARSVGVGGAFGALGADFNAVSQNPAGLAMFRSDEFVFTPGMRFANTTSRLRGAASNQLFDDEKYRLGLNNIGVVFNAPIRRGDWRNFNFSIGYNRMANFNRSIYYKGVAPGSILNGWFEETDNFVRSGGDVADLYPFGAGLAWEAEALYFQNGPLSYDFIDNPNAPITHTQTLQSAGNVNEMTFSFASNYKDKLMIGATIGVPFSTYTFEAEYEETDPDKKVQYFDNLRFTEYVRTDGTGFNIKLGAILRPTQAVRIGASIHTPSFMNMTDSFFNTLNYTFTDNKGTQSTEARSPDGVSEYRLRTPWRAMLSGALLAGKYGFVSGDVEWINYSNSRFNLGNGLSQGDQEAEQSLNANLGRSFQKSMNMRLGAELALGVARLRAGYNWIGRPYQGDTGFSTAWSAGAGLRFDRFYVDAAYRHAAGDGSVTPYSGGPTVSVDDRASDFLLTFGFKF